MEQWMVIHGYCDRYEVSNYGNVRSNQNGKQRLLKQMTNAGKYNGYKMVTLYPGNGTSKKVKVHRLVAEAFIPNPNGYTIINHKDEDKQNNNVSNLEWCTKAYNNAYNDAYKRRVESHKRRHLGI